MRLSKCLIVDCKVAESMTNDEPDQTSNGCKELLKTVFKMVFRVRKGCNGCVYMELKLLL